MNANDIFDNFKYYMNATIQGGKQISLRTIEKVREAEIPTKIKGALIKTKEATVDTFNKVKNSETT